MIEYWSIKDIIKHIRPFPYKKGDEFYSRSRIDTNRLNYFKIHRISSRHVWWVIYKTVNTKTLTTYRANFCGTMRIDKFNEWLKMGKTIKV